MSAYNALTRDLQFGYRFLEEFQDKLLFGTDISRPVEEDVKIVSYIKNALADGNISRLVYEKITRRNAERLLNCPSAESERTYTDTEVSSQCRT